MNWVNTGENQDNENGIMKQKVLESGGPGRQAKKE